MERFSSWVVALVFVELAMLRSHEFGVAAPWTRAAHWVKSRLGRQQTLYIDVPEGELSVALSLRAKQRPSVLQPDASTPLIESNGSSNT